MTYSAPCLSLCKAANNQIPSIRCLEGCFSGARSFSGGAHLKNARGVTSAMIESALSASMTRLDEDFGKAESSHDSGSTAVVVLLSNILICVANIGEYWHHGEDSILVLMSAQVILFQVLPAGFACEHVRSQLHKLSWEDVQSLVSLVYGRAAVFDVVKHCFGILWCHMPQEAHRSTFSMMLSFRGLTGCAMP